MYDESSQEKLFAIEKEINHVTKTLPYDTYKSVIAEKVTDFILKEFIFTREIQFCTLKDDYATALSLDGKLLERYRVGGDNDRHLRLLLLPHLQSKRADSAACPFLPPDKHRYLCLTFERDVEKYYLRIVFDENSDLSQEDLFILRSLSLMVSHHLYMVKNDFNSVLNRYSRLRRELGHFIHTVSHDLKSPLASIIGFSSLLNDEIQKAGNSEIQHYSERIIDNSKILEKRIDDLLYLSRLEKKDEYLFDTSEIIKEALVLLQLPIAEKQLALQIKNDLPQVYGHREHLVRIFNQILANAVMFSKERGKIIIGNNGSHFFVQDNGVGIKAENLKKVFTIFFTTCRKNPQCTGSGLFIIKKIIELYNGEIRVESREGRGTTVYFSLTTSKMKQ
jgi:signal transduction histidine kinase